MATVAYLSLEGANHRGAYSYRASCVAWSQRATAASDGSTSNLQVSDAIHLVNTWRSLCNLDTGFLYGLPLATSYYMVQN
jgi:hypothetical protein